MIRLPGSAKSGNPPRSAPSPVPFSSFSNLSPLAPPFTVDRSLPSVTNPSSLPPLPPAGPAPSKSAYSRSNPTVSTVPYFVPTGDSAWPPSSPASSAGSSRLGNPNSVFGAVDAAPFYPYYTPILDSVDSSLGQLPCYKGYAGVRSGPFDVERGMPLKGSTDNSSWMDPSQSSQMLLPSHKVGSGESLCAHKESFGSWYGAHNESSSVLDHVGSDCSEWLDERHLGVYEDNNRTPADGSHATELDSVVWPNEGSSYFYSPETTSVVKECDTFTPSPYERYISQLISNSRDSTANYLAPTSLRRGYASSIEKNDNGSLFSCAVSKHRSSVVKHVNTSKNDDDYKVHTGNGYEDAEGGTSLDKARISGEVTKSKNGVPDSYFLVKGLSSSNISTLRQSTDCSEDVNSGFKVTNLKSCKASNSEIDTFVHDDFLQASSEIHDLNVAVDSPCWKGASMSRHDPFGSDEFLESLVISATSCSDELVHGQISSEIEPAIKLTGTSVCNVNGKDIPSAILKDTSLVTNLSDADCKIHDCTGTGNGSNPASLENVIEIEQQDSHEKYNVSTGQVSVPQVIDDHVRQLSQVRCIISEGNSNFGESAPAVQKSEPVSNHTCNCTDYPFRSKSYASNGEMILSCQDTVLSNEPKKSVSSDAPSKCFSQGHDSPALVKAMLSLSEILSCHYCIDNDSFEEDLKHVRQIIDNLELFILRNKKGITWSCPRVPGMEETHLEVKKSNAGKISRKSSMDSDENKNLMGADLDNKKHNNMKSFSTRFEYADGIAQSFTKVLNRGFMEQEEDPKILLYKSLWMQTEAALCSLKHDVTLMKLEMGSFKHHFKGVGRSPTLPAESLVVPDSHGCEKHQGSNPTNTEAVKNHAWNLSKEDEVDASVISRFRILKGRHEADFAAAEGINAKGSYMDVEKGVLPLHNTKTIMVSRPNNIPTEKLPGVDYRVGNGFCLNDFEPAGAQEFRLPDPKNHVKWLLSSGSPSPSSEWEHVLRDDFMQ